MSRESFPELPQMPDVLAQIPVSVLVSMILKTIFAISAEESRFTLNGSLLLLKSNGLAMIATDGHRLAMVEHPIELAGFTTPGPALLPPKAMGEIVKLGQDTAPHAVLQFPPARNHRS